MTTTFRGFPLAALLTMLLAAPAAHAQQWLVNNAINNQIMETAICDGALRRHERLPDVCAKYPRYAGAKAGQAGVATSRAVAPTATRFTPVAGNDAVKQLADGLGNTPEERKQILQLADAGKQMFALKYKGKWTNTVAGAMTFFIASVVTVQTEREPDAEAQQHLFDAINATLAQSDIVRAADKDKTALYDVLLASAGLPLVFYVDGKQQGNAAQVAQAKAMAAGFSRKLMGVEPPALVAMLQPGASPADRGATQATSSTPAAGGLDGRYDCQMLSVRAGASFSVEYRPIGLWFSIAGNGYSATGGGGRIDADAGAVGFQGGAYDGWRGARINDAIVFRKDDHGNPRAGDGIRNGDIRCGRH